MFTPENAPKNGLFAMCYLLALTGKSVYMGDMHKPLCHLRMTPYGGEPQHIKDVPYTTPAKRDPEIGPRA